MKKTKKYLKFQDIELNTTQEHPKDISRAHFKLIDTANNAFYKTFHYGTVEPTRVHWASPIEMPFQAQESLQFQTVCEHQYGYQIEELKALYNGNIYLKPDQFFFYNTTHCLNQEGAQCGTLKFMVKIVEKQITNHGEQKESKEVTPTETIKVSLVAKVSIYGATLAVHSYYANTFHKKKKKRNLTLQIRYDKETYHGHIKQRELEYKWSINSKFEVNDNSPEIIYITIHEDQHLFLEGTLTMATLEANKRFTVQIVQLLDQNDENLAALHLDLRYISKKQLLDLMYSPKQLSLNKLDRKQQNRHFKESRIASVVGGLKTEKEKKLYDLLHHHSHSKEISSSRDKLSPLYKYRYKHRFQSDHDNTTIPRSKRFNSSQAPNQYVSYIDPIMFSDFSPQHGLQKGATQSSTNKTDFTKHLKANPGVGQYHLPSIWQKK